MHVGLDKLTAHLRTHWRGARIGLLCHAASTTSTGQHAIGLLARNSHWYLTTLFGPEHGATTTAEDMEGVASVRDAATGLPLYSLYGDSPRSLKPTAAMLAHLDALVIDLQDIGTRYYTYIYTMTLCMKACAKLGRAVIVCDRPNPIDGVTVEGPLGAPGFESFVGLFPLPVRHGMTIGEIARYVNATRQVGAALTVLPMEGWNRASYGDQTGLPWINPSPNMRSLTAALLYPGMCLLEATNVAEGRGTATPFEHCGAPWIDGAALAAMPRAYECAGVTCTPTTFVPTARKYAGQRCHGIRCTVTDRTTFRPYAFGLALLHAVITSQQGFRWRNPSGPLPDDGPYEFVIDRPAIDLLTGSDAVRAALDQRAPWPTLRALADGPSAEFLQRRTQHLLYGGG